MNKADTTTIQKFDVSLFINKHKYLIALGVFISYLCLSMYKIGNNSLWYDEGFSIDLAHDSIDSIILSSLRDDPNPPLYIIILHYWISVFGDSETGLRSLSAVAMSLAGSILFLFCRRFFNWQTAIFATLFFFTSNEIYYYSEEGRTFGLIILFCTLSIYSFMNLIKSPNWKNTLFLGIFNAIIFYLHTLASLWFVAQIILIFILAFKKEIDFSKDKITNSFLGYNFRHIWYYLSSWAVFYVLFFPWQNRFFELLHQTGGGFWLPKPSLWDLKKCLFEFHNSKELFFVYFILFIVILIIIVSAKKYREDSFDYKLILAPLIMGPLLMCINYIVSIYTTPIFLKRYILFSLLGFFIAYSYVFSLLKIDFKIKISLFFILIIFTASKMVLPRDSWYDFKSGVELIKKAENSRCFIYTDMPTLFAYYLDKDKIFNTPRGEQRDKLLAEHGVYYISNIYWPNTLDYSKYDDVYYTETFAGYADPNHSIDSTLSKKLILVEDIKIKGIHIAHYVVPVNKDSLIKVLKQEIKLNEGWYKQIIQKAKERNISTDSMLTLDAIWNFEQKYKPKR
jgi:hypothetical protein